VNNIDLMKLQDGCGTYIKPNRATSDVGIYDVYIGSEELVRKYIDELPKEEPEMETIKGNPIEENKTVLQAPQPTIDVNANKVNDNAEIEQSDSAKPPQLKFTEYLHHTNKDALITKLHELLNGKKGKDVAIIIKALEELKIIVKKKIHAPLYRAMRDEFGKGLGSNQSINDFVGCKPNTGTKKEMEESVNIIIEILKTIE
jgi:hypothetical protein